MVWRAPPSPLLNGAFTALFLAVTDGPNFAQHEAGNCNFNLSRFSF
jgi:hypothetical protein